MRTKTKETKMLQASQSRAEESPLPESLDMSSIERASILGGVPDNTYGNPLHSTAMEEDMRLLEEEEDTTAGEEEEEGGGRRGGLAKAAPAAVAKQRPAASPPGAGEKKRRRKTRSVGETEAAGPTGRGGGRPGRQQKTSNMEEKWRAGSGKRSGPPSTRRKPRPHPAAAHSETPCGVTPADRETGSRRVSRPLQHPFVARPGQNKGAEKENKRGRKVVNRKSSSSLTPSPGPKRARTTKSSSQSADRRRTSARKSSSSDEGAVTPATPTGSPGERPRRGADSSLVLDSFLAICQTYKESVESTAVRHAIDTFSSAIKEQVTEMITSSKEHRGLKRDNAKVDSLIKKKRHKLLDAKYELSRAEQQLDSLRKEKVELGQRLAHLRRGRSFLHGIRDLTTRYLAHRRAHPTEKEQYGSPSLPALLLEAKRLLRAEDHLRNINNRLQTRTRENGTNVDV